MRYEQALRQLRALFAGVPPLKACLGNDRRLPNKEEWSTFISNLKVYLQDKSFRRQYRIGSWKKMALENMLKGSGKRATGNVSAMAAAGILAIVGGTSLAPKDVYAQDATHGKPAVVASNDTEVVAATQQPMELQYAAAADQLYQRGNYGESLRYAWAAIQSDRLTRRDQSNMLFLMGMSYHQMGKVDDALNYFQQARNADPGHIIAGLNISGIHRHRGEHAQARAEASRVLGYLNQMNERDRPDNYASLVERTRDFIN